MHINKNYSTLAKITIHAGILLDQFEQSILTETNWKSSDPLITQKQPIRKFAQNLKNQTKYIGYQN